TDGCLRRSVRQYQLWNVGNGCHIPWIYLSTMQRYTLYLYFILWRQNDEKNVQSGRNIINQATWMRNPLPYCEYEDGDKMRNYKGEKHYFLPQGRKDEK
ncbi:MAG: hypothetical protein IJR87_04340, partial [Bacteroidaceae bacterium]|nr:hypothetical protein [Bacteroidaceae bacterium]